MKTPTQFRARFAGIAAAALATTTTLFSGTARAQSFIAAPLPVPPLADGGTIKDISDDNGLLVEGQNARGSVFDVFHYPFDATTNTYQTPFSVTLSGLSPGALDRVGGVVVGGLGREAATMRLSGGPPNTFPPSGSLSSFVNAGDRGHGAGWLRTSAGKHATHWFFPLHIDDHPFIQMDLGGEWVSTEWRGVESLGGDNSVRVGWGEQRNLPGKHALMQDSRTIDLHPAGYTESEAWASNNGIQCGWGKDPNGVDNALVWFRSAGSFVSLNPKNYGNCRAQDIAPDGVVGYGNLNGVSRAAFWKHVPGSNGNPDTFGHLDLHPYLPAGSSESKATGITRGGVIAGQYRNARGNWIPVLWHPIHLTSITLPAARLLGGVPTMATLTISRPAPAGGLVVNVYPQFGPNMFTSVRTVTIPANQTSVSFSVNTRGVSGPTAASVWAILGYETVVANVTLDTFSIRR